MRPHHRLPDEEAGPARAATSTAAESWKDGFVYFDKLAENRAVKAALLLSQVPRQVLHDGGAGYVILDLGCAGGDVLAEIAGDLPRASLIGIDIKSKAVEDSRKKLSAGHFHQFDIRNRPWPLADASVHLTNLSAVCHELVDPRVEIEKLQIVTEVLREVLRISKPGGKLVIREPTLPTDGSARLILSLSTSQRLTASRPRVAAAYTGLTEAELFARFLDEWIYLGDAPIERLAADEKTGHLSYLVPAWIVAEYARKRTFVDEAGNWQSEMHEQNAAFTALELERCTAAAGFDHAKTQRRSLMEPGYYGEIKEGDGVLLLDTGGSPIDQAEALPSHTYLITGS